MKHRIGIFALILAFLGLTYFAYGASTTVTASLTPGITLSDPGSSTNGFQQSFQARFPNGYAPTSFSNGSGSLQINKRAYLQLTLSASTPQTIDLTTLPAGTYGDTSFSNIKVLYIVNNSAAGTGKTVAVGNAASTSFQGRLTSSATETVDAGTVLYWYTGESAGWACGTNKNLKLDPGSNTTVVDIVIAGN